MDNIWQSKFMSLRESGLAGFTARPSYHLLSQVLDALSSSRQKRYPHDPSVAGIAVRQTLTLYRVMGSRKSNPQFAGGSPRAN